MNNIVVFVYHASILFSAVMALIYRKGLRSRGLSLLIPFLFLVFIQEVYIYFFYLKNSPGASTGIFYNIYKPLTIVLFGVLYYRVSDNVSIRKLFIWLIGVYLAVNIYVYSSRESIFIFNSYLSLTGSLIMTCYGIFFLFTYFNMDSSTEEKYWQPLLWVTIGILILYPVISISYAFREQLLAYKVTIFGKKLYHLIPQVMSIFMYSCFARAFYLCRKTT